MRYFLLIGIFFLTSVLADKSVLKTVTINQMQYADKTFLQVKEIALQEAKNAAAKEIYGEVVISETVMANGKILDDVVREQSGGIVRIKGEPKFGNGENFGDIVVSIEAYATDEDLKNREMLKSEILFDKSGNGASEKIAQVRRGFYGTWSGFVMRRSGGSGDIMIKITDSGEATINYDSLHCGGELIIEEKGADLVKFKERLTYGADKCIDNRSVSLKKLSNTQLLYMQFNEHGEEVSKGTLYREE
ncbi:hypothetical protein [Sulfurimonas sp.]|uniref:hypothetical protein n=1 Tax=Sulfurimonas sp. TaxID=2022749 RepID=UPI0025CCF171|nr:hypothetical protein [Sulfurimonas sp.]MBW6489455.1 hypothetical protein [Sulfurimonas sp.]